MSKACKGTHSTRNKHPIIVMSTLPPTSKDKARIVNLLNFIPSGSSVSGGHSVSLCVGPRFHFLLSKGLQSTH